MDSETHEPLEVQAKRIMDTNSMVEEFMLLANVSVAERVATDFPQSALLRRHPAPPPANFNTFLKAARRQVIIKDNDNNNNKYSLLHYKKYYKYRVTKEMYTRRSYR